MGNWSHLADRSLATVGVLSIERAQGFEYKENQRICRIELVTSQVTLLLIFHLLVMPREMQKEVQSRYSWDPSRYVMAQRHRWCGATGTRRDRSHARLHSSDQALLNGVTEYWWDTRLLGGLAHEGKGFRVASWVMVRGNAENSGSKIEVFTRARKMAGRDKSAGKSHLERPRDLRYQPDLFTRSRLGYHWAQTLQL